MEALVYAGSIIVAVGALIVGLRPSAKAHASALPQHRRPLSGAEMLLALGSMTGIMAFGYLVHITRRSTDLEATYGLPATAVFAAGACCLIALWKVRRHP